MHVILVMPCLNEQILLATSCASLGFGIGEDRSPPGTHLVLVDNGSTDSTTNIITQVATNSRPGTVVFVLEREKGYVPARHAGLIEAARVAGANKISLDEILILQVDADTVYDEHYIPTMSKAATDRSNVVFEGSARIARDFVIQHPRYCQLCDAIDDRMQSYFAAPEDDVVVSDFASGFLLSDYFAWGGHRREFNSNGDEVYAETSRLLIRAKMMGAFKYTVPTAVGYPSRRKIIADPLRYFATGGFPREKKWQQWWDSTRYGVRDLAMFEDAIGHSILNVPIELRERHLLALFAVLPEYVKRVFFGTRNVNLADPVAEMLAALPDISRSALRDSTAPLFEAVFALIDNLPLRSAF